MRRSIGSWYGKHYLPLTVLGVFLLSPVNLVFAHGGHDHSSDFQPGNSPSVQGIQVDGQTAKRLGIVVEPVRREFLDIGIRTTAEIAAQPDQQVSVNAPINGTVTELRVKPGDRVKKEQLLAVVVAPELIELRVNAQTNRTQAQAALRQAQANLTLAERNYQRQVTIARAQIKAAQGQLHFAQDRYNRDRELVQAGAIARQQVLGSEAELATAQSQLTRANSRESVLQAEAELDRAKAALDAAQAQMRLSTATYETRLQQLNSPATNQGLVTVVAPIDGVVVNRTVTLGQAVEEAVTPLMQIVNGDRLLVTANVYEKDLGAIAPGQRVRATVASLPGRIFNGRVIVVGAVVDSEKRTIPVTAELVNTSDLLKPTLLTRRMKTRLPVWPPRSTPLTSVTTCSPMLPGNWKMPVECGNGWNNAIPPWVSILEMGESCLTKFLSITFNMPAFSPAMWGGNPLTGLPAAEIGATGFRLSLFPWKSSVRHWCWCKNMCLMKISSTSHPASSTGWLLLAGTIGVRCLRW
ncbi:efflux RND transporter periplasmic adaptor subunit [Leptothermofonsia sichuanensis E412]|nr:efflux RND transporter periplasmic adaptor subunit [Leptothermofonsia sichuanensis E412]